MGERGPLPVPYARRRIRRKTGYQPTKVVTVSRPSMPRELAGEAKKEWQRIVPELEDIGVISTIDRALLIRYCRAWANWLELDALVEQSSKLIRGQKGNLVRNPAWLLRRDAEDTVTELGRQLGLSPMARLRSGIEHKRPPDPHEEDRRNEAIDHYKRMFEDEPRGITS